MRLLKVRFRDFRRLKGKCSLDVDEALVALVGPNEAGKSSVLDGIDMLLTGRFPGERDVTRGSRAKAEVGGLFYLEPDDRAALAGIHEGELVERVWVSLESGSTSKVWGPEPFPRRDLTQRKTCLDLLRAFQGEPGPDARFSPSPQAPWEPQLYANVLEQLSSDEEELDPAVIATFEALATTMRALGDPILPTTEGEDEIDEEVTVANERLREHRDSVVSALADLVRVEEQHPPWRQVADILNNRLPSVAFFRSEDRELRTEYVLSEIVNDPPHALENLCTVARLSIAELNADWQTNMPRIEKLIEDANTILKRRFQLTWSQSAVYPRFGTPYDGILRLIISTEGDAAYTEAQERSDGLLWFLALDAFLAAQGTRLPVLLVDEAETHLHYDAQADLIDVLMRQNATSKVIYSTHSVGCLPPDLGRGIRAVLPEPDAERSKIENSYWSIEPDGRDKVGYTPLLFAMGATLLSLTVPRYGLICEGPSDAILLPTLMREVTDLPTLPYRIVPGLSEISKSQMGALSQHAGKLACLTDGDTAGAEILKQIKDTGEIGAACLFSLSRIAKGCTLEDLVDAEVFARAVNIELETWSITTARLISADVPGIGRSSSLEIWCEANGGDPGVPKQEPHRTTNRRPKLHR